MFSLGTLLFIAIPLLAFLIAWPLIWSQRKGVARSVARWAAENGFEVVAYREKAFFLFTPFALFSMSRAQHLVLADIRNQAGEQKKCWLKIGDFFGGLMIYRVECKWIE